MRIDFIINFLLNQFDSSNFDKDVLKYGLQVVIYNAFTIVLLVLLSIICNKLFFGLLFIPIFCGLRITIGGFHCKTLIGCISSMTLIYILILFLSNIDLFNTFLIYVSPLLILLLLFVKSCEENTIHINTYLIHYNYVLIIIFTLLYTLFYKSIFFTPIYSALFVAEITYILK